MPIHAKQVSFLNVRVRTRVDQMAAKQFVMSNLTSHKDKTVKGTEFGTKH